MYATESTVRTLAKNVKTISAEQIAAFASVVDAEIDSALFAIYGWPYDSNGAVITPTPTVIITIANLMTAGWIEASAYAQQQGGESEPQNPFGGRLLAAGRKLLQLVCEGKRDIPELTEPTRIAGLAPSKKFRGIGGTRNDDHR